MNTFDDPNIALVVGIFILSVCCVVFMEIYNRWSFKQYNKYLKEHNDEAKRCQESINQWKTKEANG